MLFLIKGSFLIVLIVMLIKKYIHAYKEYNIQLEILFNFLQQKEDIEALKSLGAINPFGVMEKWHVPSRKIKEYLSTREDLLKEKEVLEFLKKLDSFNKAYLIYFMSALIIIFLILLIMTK